MSMIFSGIQPTGDIHLGNYIGALSQWVNLQNKGYSNIYCVVDLHAITVFNDPLVLNSNILGLTAFLIACGIDVDKSILFAQSHNHNHSELAWILNCTARLGWLNRMTQFKEKSGKNKENNSVGLYAYPNLQAADILLYDSNFVPVGEDQKQHIELCRDIAQKFNNDYKTDCFIIPEPMIMKESARIMSLQDGSKKMSKSDPSDLSKILFSDDNDAIRKKISKAKTDPLPLPSSMEEAVGRKEVLNLLSIYSFCVNSSIEDAINIWQGKGFKDFKLELSDLVVALVEPIRNKQQDLFNNKDYLKSVLKEGARKSLEISELKMQQVKDILGFVKL